MNPREQTEYVLAGIRERIDWLNEEVKPLIENMNPESKQLRAPDMEAFATYIREQYPTQLYRFPDGHLEAATAWGLLLKNNEWKDQYGRKRTVVGAKQLMRQMERGLE